MSERDQDAYDKYLEDGKKPLTLEELQELTMEDLEVPKHTCIFQFGEISVTFIEYEIYWQKEETAQCELCCKVYVSTGDKVFKNVVKYGCQLETWEWKEVK